MIISSFRNRFIIVELNFNSGGGGGGGGGGVMMPPMAPSGFATVYIPSCTEPKGHLSCTQIWDSGSQ